MKRLFTTKFLVWVISALAMSACDLGRDLSQREINSHPYSRENQNTNPPPKVGDQDSMGIPPAQCDLAGILPLLSGNGRSKATRFAENFETLMRVKVIPLLGPEAENLSGGSEVRDAFKNTFAVEVISQQSLLQSLSRFRDFYFNQGRFEDFLRPFLLGLVEIQTEENVGQLQKLKQELQVFVDAQQSYLMAFRSGSFFPKPEFLQNCTKNSLLKFSMSVAPSDLPLVTNALVHLEPHMESEDSLRALYEGCQDRKGRPLVSCLLEARGVDQVEQVIEYFDRTQGVSFLGFRASENYQKTLPEILSRLWVDGQPDFEEGEALVSHGAPVALRSEEIRAALGNCAAIDSVVFSGSRRGNEWVPAKKMIRMWDFQNHNLGTASPEVVRGEMVYTFLHEAAHGIEINFLQLGLNPSPLGKEWLRMGWSTDPQGVTPANAWAKGFFTPYAATNPSEDFAEVVAAYVTGLVDEDSPGMTPALGSKVIFVKNLLSSQCR